MKKFRIVSIASEVAPFSKTGGLADVARSLPKSLKRLGHDVIVITPFYKRIIDLKINNLTVVFRDVPLSIPDNFSITVDCYKGELMKGLPIYFVSYDKYFGRKKSLYGSADENKRFYTFDAAALALLMTLGYKADIIHCHDWFTGLIPELLKKTYKDNETLGGAATVFTIHNLAFQLGHNWWEIEGPKRDNGVKPLPGINNQRQLERINFAKRAILHADVVNAVSDTYAQEILEPRFGQDLHRILQNRKHKLFGIVNGIDYKEYNPARDPGLAKNYDYRRILRKHVNKRALQHAFRLSRDEDALLMVMVSRIAEQKGFDILLPIIPEFMKVGRTQLIIMGDGDKEYSKTINKLIRKYSDRIALTQFDHSKETMLYAGGDVSLFPSRFEPCGIGQLKSMRYGCVPIAHATGGLSDTVDDYDADTASGNGFTFTDYSPISLLVAMTRAYSHFTHRKEWRNLVVRDMKQSFSWEIPAKKYLELYRKAVKLKQSNDQVG